MSSSLSSRSSPQFDPAADRLRSTLIAAYSEASDQAVLDDLRDAISEYVGGQKRFGVRAEEVIIAVKRLIELSDLRRTLPRDHRELTERVVTWCIGDYYRAD
jgi:hypothetical protein